MDDAPFEGVLGDQKHLAILEHLLSMPNQAFTRTELKKDLDIGLNTIDNTLKIFTEWGMVKIAGSRSKKIKVNPDSDIVKSLVLFNYSLIDRMDKDYSMFDMAMQSYIDAINRRYSKQEIGRPSNEKFAQTAQEEAEPWYMTRQTVPTTANTTANND